ncbi:hypothetical protein RFI_06736 [Reticulomyxa filosa]|uniref:Guanylate cyclase domain-containing protein n=1 Tax=Reticulomyxa filosa TaxID=46433 RepID=X6NVS2_RETFI|nr:hypothetical protein RFI_06736 [Reticulomyxa filosa]|eukprot:ETO30385.1 hypothetical protein RFI_06736 [Reticulomyxa filosa]
MLLPLFVAQQLLRKSMSERNRRLLKQQFRSATVFQSDLMGFTQLSSTLDPSFIVSLLHHLYAKYDQFATQFNVEKIETIGDAYICVSFGGHPEHIIEFALNVVNMHIQLKDYRIPNIFQHESVSNPININIRIGIAHGHVLGCILGRSCLRFHIFGNALDRAIQLEGKCLPNSILGIYTHIFINYHTLFYHFTFGLAPTACPQTKAKCEDVLVNFIKHDTLDAYWVSRKES